MILVLNLSGGECLSCSRKYMPYESGNIVRLDTRIDCIGHVHLVQTLNTNIRQLPRIGKKNKDDRDNLSLCLRRAVRGMDCI
jgi:hypothetical protein